MAVTWCNSAGRVGEDSRFRKPRLEGSNENEPRRSHGGNLIHVTVLVDDWHSEATICIPWCVTFLGYSFFHISYPSDMRKLKALS